MSSQAWKDANYDRSIKVSQGAIDELKSRGTKEANIAYYKKHGATAEQREAMNRFYGKNTISSNTIASFDAPNIRENRASDPSPIRPNARENRVQITTPVAPSPSVSRGYNGGLSFTPPKGSIASAAYNPMGGTGTTIGNIINSAASAPTFKNPNANKIINPGPQFSGLPWYNK